MTLEVSAEQQVLNTGSDGRAVVQQLDTGGDMNAMKLEFSVVGKQGGSKTASTGPVIFNYGTNSNNNLVSAWRPSNFTIALLGTDFATGIDLTDGQSHRVTISWDSSTGEMRVFDNGVFQKAFTGASKDTAIPDNGHLVLAQKMNNPGSRSGWNAGEHYSGKIFGTTLATSTFTAQPIAGAPLYTNQGQLVADLRSQGGNMVDVTGKHSVEMQGSPSVSNMHVNTDLALIPPGAIVKVNPKAKPGDTRSKITNLSLQGLGGLTLTGGKGNSGIGSVNITNWDLNSLSITLPPGFNQDVNLHLIAVAIADDGEALLADDRANLRMAATP